MVEQDPGQPKADLISLIQRVFICWRGTTQVDGYGQLLWELDSDYTDLFWMPLALRKDKEKIKIKAKERFQKKAF